MQITVTTGNLFTVNGRTAPERYEDISVTDDSVPTSPRCVMYMNYLPMPVVGEVWWVYGRIHVTNEGPRDRKVGVCVVTELRIGMTGSHNRQELPIAPLTPDGGDNNVGVEAHHGWPTNFAMHQWTQADIDNLIGNFPAVKFFISASSTSALTTDRLIIDRGQGQLELTRFIP